MAKKLKSQPKLSRKPAPRKASPKAVRKSPPKAAVRKPVRKPPRPAKEVRKAARQRPAAPSRATATAKTAERLPSPSPSATQQWLTLSGEQSRNTQQLYGGSQTEIHYLTPQDLIELHKAISTEFGGTHGRPGEVESQYGLTSAVQRPQTTVFGKDAYPSFSDKAAAFLFALLQNSPFRTGNRRLALAALLAFCELNGRSVDTRALDEKTLEALIKRAAGHREMGIAPENVFSEMRTLLNRAIG